MSLYSYIGKGKIWIRVRNAAAPRLFIGNVDKLDFKTSEDKQDLPDFTQAGGGLDDSQTTIKSVGVEMNIRNLSPENIARALKGSSTPVAAGAITDEVQIAYKDGLVRLDHIPDPATPIVVTNSAGTTTYVLDTDYEMTKGGFHVLSAGAITDAQSLKVDYTKLAQYDIQALIDAGEEYELNFEGLNEAKSGLPFIVDAFRVKFGSADTLSLIGAQFGGLAVKGDVLVDDTKTGAGVSKYFKAQMAKST